MSETEHNKKKLNNRQKRTGGKKIMVKKRKTKHTKEGSKKTPEQIHVQKINFWQNNIWYITKLLKKGHRTRTYIYTLERSRKKKSHLTFVPEWLALTQMVEKWRRPQCQNIRSHTYTYTNSYNKYT